VFVAVADPVGVGLVRSLVQPGGNITGLATLVPGNFLAKQIEILRELVPSASNIAILANPENPLHRMSVADEFPRTAQKLGIALPTVEASKPEELNNIKRVMAIIGVGGLLEAMQA
jgi:putative tryptophan/tyrosine transport system substrate-binding protein